MTVIHYNILKASEEIDALDEKYRQHEVTLLKYLFERDKQIKIIIQYKGLI